MEMQRIAIHACEIAVRCLEGLRQDAFLITYKGIRNHRKLTLLLSFRGVFAQRQREPLGLFRPCRTLRNAEQARPRHQPCDAVQAGRLALVAPFFVHARCAHHAIARGLLLMVLLQQTCVVLRPGPGHARAPGMTAAGRHLQASAHQANRVLAAATLDRLVLQDHFLVKDAAASLEKSRSFFKRLSASTSWSRDTPAPGKGFLARDFNSRRHRQRRFEAHRF